MRGLLLLSIVGVALYALLLFSIAPAYNCRSSDDKTAG